MRHDQYGFHVSRWPAFHRPDRRRVPARLVETPEGWRIVDPDGQAWMVSNHNEALAVCANPWPDEPAKTKRRLDLFVARIGHYPWLNQAMGQTGTTAYGSARGASGLACRFGRCTLRIGESSAWGYEQATDQFLHDLVALFTTLGVGAYVTPGALGGASMEQAFWDGGEKQVSRPSAALRSALLEHRIGGRSDPPPADQLSYEEIYELDLHDAYASAAAQPLPWGPITRIVDQDDDDPRPSTARYAEYATYFAHAVVYLAQPLRRSPVLIRDATGRLIPLAKPGRYEIWRWKKELDALRMCPGVTIVLLDGWAWRECRAVLAGWANDLHARRAEAPPEIARLVKLAIVAGIGRHGMPPERRTLVRAEDANPGDSLVDGWPGSRDYYAITTTPDDDSNALTHWHEYIVMLIRLWQWERGEEERANGNTIVCTNVDAIYVTAPSRGPLDPTALGGVRQRQRTHVIIPYVRAIIADGIDKRPGVPRTGRIKCGSS